jgi:hypothetical protein
VGFDGLTKSRSGSFLKHLSMSTPLKNATDLNKQQRFRHIFSLIVV